MIRVYFRFRVADPVQWQNLYQENAEFRQTWGVRDHGAYRHCVDPQDITMFHDFDTMDAAGIFLADLKASGVASEVTVPEASDVWITQSIG
ncbi:hypothetical protein [Chachezhania antarctica]|uniref:hypothetical protein n=1 Tax=Chachezhania antarctica TaxID=2340860 RepID=UPI000EAD75BC|nr:hypothetical protein [Chachezhania antarctica]|tara:strand:+ start:3174 stop:3446 length:273 start_codon:yes stop_codon:yes gene_type:complete